MNTINFTAKLLQKKQILKRDKDENYKPCDISIIELDKNDCKDLYAMQKASLDWIIQGGGALTYNMYDNATKKYSYFDSIKEHYLAATVQDTDYANPDYKKILGFSLFLETDKPFNTIKTFEVMPKTSESHSKNREYKKVGKALLNYIQKTYNQKPIYVVSKDESIDFYKKNNFRQVNDYPNCHYLIYDS